MACAAGPMEFPLHFTSTAKLALAPVLPSKRRCRPASRSLPGRVSSGDIRWSPGIMHEQREQTVRIFIVDDHPVVVAGLTSMLGTQPGMGVAGWASGGEEAVGMLRTVTADLLLLDLRMPGMNGIDTLHALVRAGVHIRAIVLTSYETDEDIYRAVQAGAQGYLLKDAPQTDMVEAIWTVHHGKRYFPR